MKLSRFSRVILVCLAAFLILTALFTYLSRAKYLESLPLVQTVEAAPGKLQKSYALTGTVVCERINERAVYAPADLRVLSVESVSGESAPEGAVLVRFDEKQMKLSKLALSISILELEEQKSALAGDKSEKAALTLEYLDARLALAKENLASLDVLCTDGGLCLPRAADLLYLIPRGTVNVQAGQLLARYIPFPAGKEIVFTLPDSALPPKVGTNITCALPVYDPQTEALSVQTEQHLPIAHVTQKDGVYTFTVPIERANVWLHEGEQIALEVSFVGETEYPFVVPRTAVQLDGESAAVYLLTEQDSPLGKQTLLRRQTVSVRAMDDERAVLSADPGGKIARFASACADGQLVRVW
ncbi:MAG: hypothetical protein II727_00625 [Oscillospiraceae bacterium]|nr:hypothetical protein [Oscillospiraceae bacterium]